MNLTLPEFVVKWQNAAADEKAHKDSFLKDLCWVLDLPQPEPSRDDPEQDRYVFERRVRLRSPEGKVTTRFADLYKEGCFVLEAKQSSEKGAKKHGTAVRATTSWDNAMTVARTQAVTYAEHLEPSPPFVIVCDIGNCFDVYACFDGSARYQGFPNAEKKRRPFKDLASYADELRTIWTDPYRLDPSKYAKEVSEEIAEQLAELARDLEANGHPPKVVAEFLMRCLFTMFAEDVNLLPDKMFTTALKEFWIPSPATFVTNATALWRSMNDGSPFGLGKPLLRFNGGLFDRSDALPLTETQLRMLLAAAERDWSAVEPAIFGTLLERALDPDERHMLGAHYTPRAYVERLVRPTVEEPLRAEWSVVQAEVWRFREEGKVDAAKKALREYHHKLTQVLRPAGRGIFFM